MYTVFQLRRKNSKGGGTGKDFLMGQNRQAEELLSKFRWGEQFMNLNKEPLIAYTGAKSSAELVSLQFEFFDIEVEDDAQ